MNTQHWELIAKNLSGEASKEELKNLSDWMKLHQDNEKAFRGARSLWVTMVKKEDKNPRVDVDLIWDKLKEKMIFESKNKVARNSLYKVRWYVAAASIAILLGISYVLMNQFQSQNISTADNIEAFYLSDSSLVYLNKNSKLEYSQSFDGGRIVYLSGEAFFYVKRDSLKPFIVKTENSTIKVLGTSFNVKAYENQQITEVIVETGEVEFSSIKSDNNKVRLKKGEKGIVINRMNIIDKSKNKNSNYSKWKDNKDNIKGTSLYKQEVNQPTRFLTTEFSYKQNVIMQTIIDGKITNRSKYVAYKNIKLKAIYYGVKGDKLGEESFTVIKTVHPGMNIYYKHKLMDWLADTKKVNIEIIEATTINE